MAGDVAPVARWLPGSGIRVHALDWGPEAAARLIFLLHGVAGNAHIWDAVASRLRGRLGDTTRVVALDGRDGGLTDHPPTGYRPDDFAADVLTVHDALGRPPLTLVGHSRAGWLATWLAERYPRRLERLVLVDPARISFGEGAAEAFYRRVRDGLGPFASDDDALAWGCSLEPDADWDGPRRAGFLANFRREPDGTLVGHLPSHAVDQMRAARETADSVGPLLDRVACRTLLLIATRQEQERIADKRAYAAGIRGCRVVELPGTHFLHTDLPDDVAGLIAGFAS